MAAVITALTTPEAASQDVLPWRNLVYTDLRFKTDGNQTYVDLWSDLIKANNDYYISENDTRFQLGNAPATEAHYVLRSKSQNHTVVVSILNTAKHCSIAANDATNNSRMKRCPARLIDFQNSSFTIEAIEGTACFVEYGTAGAAPDQNSNAMFAAYAKDTNTIEIIGAFLGQQIPECSLSIPVPKTVIDHGSNKDAPLAP